MKSIKVLPTLDKSSIGRPLLKDFILTRNLFMEIRFEGVLSIKYLPIARNDWALCATR